MNAENQETLSDFGADTSPTAQTERETLMHRADSLGVQYNANIGTDTLRKRVDDAMKDDGKTQYAKAKSKDADKADETDEPEMSDAQRRMAIRENMKREELRMIRVRITNLNPNKKDLAGEIFTVANKHLGIVKKFIPYGEATDDGYHIPNILYKQLKSRRFLSVKTRRDRTSGDIKIEQNMAPEFAMEVLDPLTPEELKQLANRQAAAQGLAS